MKRGQGVQGKKGELFKRLTDAIQKGNSDKQLSISLIKEIFLNMFEQQNKKTLEILKKLKENVTSIINDKISNIVQRLEKLTLDTNNNLTTINKVRNKTNDLTLSLETSQNIWETENKKLKEELTNLRSDLREKYGCRILSFKRPGRLYIFFDFGVGVYWRGALNGEGHLFKKT